MYKSGEKMYEKSLKYELGKANEALQRNPRNFTLQTKVGIAQRNFLNLNIIVQTDKRLGHGQSGDRKATNMTKEIFHTIKERP